MIVTGTTDNLLQVNHLRFSNKLPMFGPMILFRTNANGSSDLCFFLINGLSDQWIFGPMGRRTNVFSDQLPLSGGRAMTGGRAGIDERAGIDGRAGRH